ncbi:MAG TPA: DUF4242 domain-containing protein [Gemmatimonadaceae bacterium]|nr:DUF4242 domain-containing protein [Gemmatimonadaceae bacterium]
MPKYVIEREIPKAGDLGPADLKGIATKSNGVLGEMNKNGTNIRWEHSYVTGDKIYCVYDAPDENSVRQHAERGGFPANRIERVRQVINPKTAD